MADLAIEELSKKDEDLANQARDVYKRQGVQAGNEPFYFDIHEKKSGPHGLVAGMTGSGLSLIHI